MNNNAPNVKMNSEVTRTAALWNGLRDSPFAIKACSHGEAEVLTWLWLVLFLCAIFVISTRRRGPRAVDIHHDPACR